MQKNMRHFISISDIQTPELQRILEVAAGLKSDMKTGTRPPLLAGKMLGMIFEKPSLRTRVSFETGMFQLGGSAMFLGSEIGFGKRESVKDISEVLSSMVDAIMFRAMKHQSVLDVAKYSRCPVINGLTDREHPCQALADVMTIFEVFGQVQGIKIAWIGDANNVAASLLQAAAKLGIKMSIAAPKKFQFDTAVVKTLIGEKPLHGFEFELTDNPQQAVRGAYAIFTDVWVSMGQESEEEERKAIFAPYQVNTALMKHARPDAVFLHCLPARRGLEVTDEVMDSPQSKIIQEAENRLHAQKGMLVWLLNEANQI
jgi:ornithine carbamoyltransferase